MMPDIRIKIRKLTSNVQAVLHDSKVQKDSLHDLSSTVQ